MNKVKQTLLAVVLCTSLSSSSVLASGIPVVDAASLSQELANFMQQFNQMKQDYEMYQKQFDKMKEQYSELQNIKGKLEGVNSFGSAFDTITSTIDTSSELLKNSNSVLNDVDTTVQQYYEKLCNFTNNAMQLNCKKKAQIQASQVKQTKNAIDELQKLIRNSESIYNKARNAQTAKEIADATAALTQQQALIDARLKQFALNKMLIEEQKKQVVLEKQELLMSSFKPTSLK